MTKNEFMARLTSELQKRNVADAADVVEEYEQHFLIILYCMEIYDIAFFDWVLLCHSNFFIHYYPELRGVTGPHQFGYNKRTHILHFVIYIPVCAALAWLCTLL